MRSYFRRYFGLSILVTVILYFLSIVSVLAQSPKPEEVKFCDLIRNAEKYDGRLVKTTALYSRTVNGESLSGKDCQSTLKEQHTAEPVMGLHLDRGSKGAKTLSKLLKRGHTAQVTIMGIAHAQRGQERGYYEVPLQIEIQELDDVQEAATPK